MLGEILEAVINECNLILDDEPGTVILKTDFKNSNLPSYKMPLILLDLIDSNESGQYMGGITRMDWQFGLNSYHYAPDAYTGDTSGYSESLLNVIDKIRRHFSIGKWLGDKMPLMEEDFGFRFTLSGVVNADALESDGLVMGYRIVFDSMAIDEATDNVPLSDSVLENVKQSGSNAVNEERVSYKQQINLGINMANTQQTIPANTLINQIALINTMGTPTIRCGTAPGLDDIMADRVIDKFTQVLAQYYAESETIIYFTMTGVGLVKTRIDVTRDYFL